MGLRHFKDCPLLRVFYLGETSLADGDMAFFEEFAGRRNVTHLILSRTAIGDDGLRHLKGAGKLDQLLLDGTRITDEGLRVLEGHTMLKWTDFSLTTVGDAGLARLQRCSGLRLLSLVGTKVTASGVAALKRALPDCDITWGGVAAPGGARSPADAHAPMGISP